MRLRPRPEHIPRLKAPLGLLLTGEPEESIPKLLRLIERALGRPEAVLFVEGEEDLLAIPCILEVPDGSLIIYGQPGQGIVVVKAAQPIKNELASMVQNMGREES